MSYNSRDFTAGCEKRITINVLQQQRLHCRLLKKDYNQCLTTTETSLQAVQKGLQSMSYNSRDFTAGCEKKDYNQCLTTAETSLQAVAKGL